MLNMLPNETYKNSCPDAKKAPRRKNKTGKKLNGWKFPLQPCGEEEDDEETKHPTNEETENRQENPSKGSVNNEVLGTPTHTSR